MIMDDQKHCAQSLKELLIEVEAAIPHAQRLSYLGINSAMSLDAAQELIKAVKYYQEPRFFGWPISLVELYLTEEQAIPEQVFLAYQEHINSLVRDNETNEAFFIDEAYDTDMK